MCGVCGIVDWEGSGSAGASPSLDMAVLKGMVTAIGHRGPDEFGLYRDECAGLGHARLSIIDLSGGGQPMANEDQSLWIVFNGEIFNYVELAPELERRGHRFSTRSDTEVILHLYEEYGPRCVDYMNGQFAFAIWDRTRRVLFMARDRLGIRPLYYARIAKRLVFASEIKSLLTVPGLAARLDPIGLDHVFTFWSPIAPRTAFEGIYQLPAAHYLLATDRATRTERYWDLQFPDKDEPPPNRPKSYYVQGLREVLLDATRIRMRSDVPVAGYLSGGLDSSLTAAMIKSCTDTSLLTFSVRFQDAAFDEGAYQAEMIEHLGTDHRSTMISRDDIARAFPEVIWHTETPILRTAPVPLHYLSGLVRENGIKVVVTGEGADEVLAGYDIFKESRIRRFWARNSSSSLVPLMMGRIYPDIHLQDRSRGASFWQAFFAKGLHDTCHPCYSHLVRWGNTAALKRLFTPELRARIGSFDAVEDYARTLPSGFAKWRPLSQAQYIETTTFMTNYLLSSQGDRVAMSHGVEGRYPFLDYRVVEFAARIPPWYKLRGLEEKHILREVAREFLPEPVRQRPKQPYRAPDGVCFLGEAGWELVQETLSEDSLREAGCFEPRAVTRLLEKLRNRGEGNLTNRDDMAVVGILSTQLLYQQFVKEARRIQHVSEDRFRLRNAKPPPALSGLRV